LIQLKGPNPMSRNFIRWVILALAFAPSATLANPAETFRSRVMPLLKTHCIACHGADSPEGGVTLSGERTLDELAQQQHLWFRVLDQLDFQTMPPEGEQQLTNAERQTIMNWIRNDLTQTLAERQRQQGRSTFRRLSRTEYANTFEDLFGYRPDVDLLPEDNRVDGYTKVSAALSLSMDGAYGYHHVASDLLNTWVLRPLPKQVQSDGKSTIRATARSSGESPGHTLELPDGWFVSFNTDDSSGRLNFGGVQTPGVHKIRIHVYAYQTDQPLLFGLYTGKTLAYPQQIELAAILEAPPGQPAIVETELYLKKGAGIRLIPFGLGVQVPKNHQASKCKGPGLAIQWLELDPPEQPLLADRWLTADLPPDLIQALRLPRSYLRKSGAYSYSKLTHDEFLELMRRTFTRIGARILRRDLTEQEVDEILARIRTDLENERELRPLFLDQVADLLASPEFFCVIESPGELSDFALASRLSYFLWNSCPDEKLLQVARDGRLRDPAVLRAEADRLLADPRSHRFVTDFLDQWLDLHAINDTTPDSKLYPEFDESLKFSSLQETRATFAHMLTENLSVRDFVNPSWMFANGRLAKHYGLQEVRGADLEMTSVPPDAPYGGLWTQPAILKVTADGSSTSPVKRGVWVSERLLGVPISPPPPNITPVNPDTRGATTLREQLALHSEGGTCASCHKKFDPYGFALESFDVLGQYRTHYRVLDPELSQLPAHNRGGKPPWREGLEVDSSGITPEGETFADIEGLRSQLAQQPEKLALGVASHLTTYATATPVGPLDRESVREIVNSSAQDNYGLRSIVHGVVQSPLFRWK
jgi:mono/diheme cytochrome c family protein